jgi:hypothetical protein
VEPTKRDSFKLLPPHSHERTSMCTTQKSPQVTVKLRIDSKSPRAMVAKLAIKHCVE